MKPAHDRHAAGGTGAALRCALRMDDVGAATKRYQVYSKWNLGYRRARVSGNWLFLKYLPPFKAWGPYPELTPRAWHDICELLERTGARMTVGVTAAWADRADRLTPFPSRFPEQAAIIREGVRAGLLEIANHGLTHCVLEGNRFRPHAWTSNRVYHREFWEWVPAAVQEDHIARAQDILQDCFHERVVTFVPPGNVFTPATLEIASRHGLRYVSCATTPAIVNDVTVIGDVDVLPFHDRDLFYGGVEWLARAIRARQGFSFPFVRDLARDYRERTSASAPAHA